MLFILSIIVLIIPRPIAGITGLKSTICVIRKYVPITGTGPKNTNAKKSPHPLYPYAFSPIVYKSAAKMHNAPKPRRIIA